jgi:hypothetical protein
MRASGDPCPSGTMAWARDGDDPGASHSGAPVLHFSPLRGFSPLRKGDVPSPAPRQERHDNPTAKRWDRVGAAGDEPIVLVRFPFRASMAARRPRLPPSRVQEKTRRTPSSALTTNPHGSRRRCQPKGPRISAPSESDGRTTAVPRSVQSTIRRRWTSISQPSVWAHP